MTFCFFECYNYDGDDMRSRKKVSVVVPCYNTEKYVERCIDSLLRQTYKNFELILVNDCSPGNMLEIFDKYKKQDERIVVVDNKKNKGLFHARLAGADASSGDYICFVDSDDYVACDFLRGLVYDLEEKNADMVFCNTVVYENNQKFLYNLFDFHLEELNGEDCLKYYFDQKGICYRWHTVWNKLYTMKLWKKARKYYDDIPTHLIMTEDFAFSTVLFYFCRKIVFNEYANYYYCSNDDASTSLAAPNFKKFNKNIGDIFVSFEFVSKFLRGQKVYSKYEDDYEYWFNLYLKMWYENVKNSKLDLEEQEILLSQILERNENISECEFKNSLNFYNSKVDFNDNYEKMVEKIVDDKYSVISFDIFDTLIVRPFYEPKDLFKLLNVKYKELCPDSAIVFSDIREQAERQCRDMVYATNYYEEVTLDEIYDYINKNFLIAEVVLEKLKKYEVSLELEFTKPRRSGQNLFRLAQELGKRIILVSDIYLSRAVIEHILRNNGYTDIGRIYLSYEEKLSKSTKQLYKIVITQEGNDASKILHIGDNYGSDYLNARELGIEALHFPKATDVAAPYFSRMFLKKNYVIDSTNYLSFSGVRVALAMVANKFFDNPYVSFDASSEFNCNPALMGYFALGMHTFAVTKWLYDDVLDKKYDSVTFMARDGYLVKKQFDEFKAKYNMEVMSNYLSISRKSLVVYSFSKREDFVRLLDYFSYDTISRSDIGKLLSDIMEDDFKISENGNVFVDNKEFVNFLAEDIVPYINEEKLNICRENLKNYFLEFFVGKSANFDIGYSAKPEYTLTKLLGKEIDTYFIHFNDNNAYYYSSNAGFELNTFYDYKPSFTGMLREYVFSELSGSCKKYLCTDKKIEVVYDDIEIDYYEKWILDIMQNYSLQFTKDILSCFGDYLEALFFPRYYMSIPFEYFLHAASDKDRLVFYGLMFENTINDNVNIYDLWSSVVNSNKDVIQYGVTPSSYESITNNFYQLNVRHRNKLVKLQYYLFFDRVSLRRRLGAKFSNETLIGKVLRRGYRLIKR